jgi:hypothetical protein
MVRSSIRLGPPYVGPCSNPAGLQSKAVLPFNQDSPDDRRSSVSIRAFPAFLQDRREVQAATCIFGGLKLGRGVDLAIFLGIWAQSACRLPYLSA